MSILDHVTLVVSDYDRSKAFYEKALAPLGIQRMVEFGQAAGFGKDGKAAFWIGAAPASFQRPEHLRLITPTHLAFTAASRAEVEAFYAAALAAGARTSAPPGSAPTTIRGTMGRSSSIPTGTTSRRCSTTRDRARALRSISSRRG